MSFREKVLNLVQQVSPGKVASYGQIALYAGAPRAAREVGWILGSADIALPWWRIVNNKGYLSIRGNSTADKDLQRKLLQAENIFVDDDYKLEIEKYRWILSLEEIEKLDLSDAQKEKIMTKYNQTTLI